MLCVKFCRQKFRLYIYMYVPGTFITLFNLTFRFSYLSITCLTNKILFVYNLQQRTRHLIFPANMTNVALGKKSFQSSISGIGNAAKAVDGSTNTFYFSNSCTHTKAESDPWWQVDLAADYNVQEVMLTNRGDCCG